MQVPCHVFPYRPQPERREGGGGKERGEGGKEREREGGGGGEKREEGGKSFSFSLGGWGEGEEGKVRRGVLIRTDMVLHHVTSNSEPSNH